MFFISRGKCKLVGHHTHPIGDGRAMRRRFHFLDLLPGSWYGDYQVLLRIPSKFDFVAATEEDDDEEVEDDGAADSATAGFIGNMVQLWTISAEKFNSLMDEYPVAKKEFTIRAIKRRSHFNTMYD